MSGVKLRTKPPRNCTYLTWCEYCEESVHHADGSCSQCASFDLTYFVKESDYEAVVKEHDELKDQLEQAYALAYSRKLTINEMREEIARLREALAALSKRHDWTPGMGECICSEHMAAREILSRDEAKQGDE